MKNRVSFFCLHTCLLLFSFWTMYPALGHAADGDVISRLKFKQISTLDGLPTDEVQKIYQDKEGFLWFATRYGFCKYDGYQITVYKSSLNTPGLLTSNNIYCFADDNDGFLWIGTQEGLNTLNKKTGEIRQYTAPAIPNNAVSCLLVTRENEVWIGTDSGLCRYVAEKDSFVMYDGKSTDGIFPAASIKSLFEDSDGDLWVGTWSSGLFRYSRKEDKFYAYPKINERNSAHVIYQDSNRKMWVGGWDCGLFLLNHPKDMANVSYTHYSHRIGDDASLSDNIVYDIVEDVHTHTLWIGTRVGLSIMKQENPGTFINYKSLHSAYHIPCDEINSLLRDRFNNIWLGSIGGGVLMIDTKQSPFAFYSLNLAEDDVPTTAVRALFADADKDLWLGTGSYGLARKDYETGVLSFFSHLPEFSDIPGVPTVNYIIQRKNGEVWFATYDGGILIYEEGEKVKVLTESDTPYLYSDCVSALCEDSKGNCWVGCRGGMGISLADGGHYRFGTLSFAGGGLADWYHVKDIVEDADGSFWIATANYGIIHIMGDVQHPETLKYSNYSYNNGQLATNSVLCLHVDKSGRLWAGTEGGGLYLYNRRFAYYNNLKSGTYRFCLKATNENGIWSQEIRELEVVVLPPFWATWWAYIIYALIGAAIVCFILRTAKNRMQLRNELHLREMEKSKLEELNHAKLQFFTNITHELLTPLTIISATVDELKMRFPGHDDLYTVMGSNISRLIRLLQQILEFRKAETGNLKLRVSPGDVAAFVKNEAESFLPLVKKRKIHFSVLCNPESIIGYFDTDKLDKILYNLLSNAAKYNKEGGYIQVTLMYAEDRDFVRLHVKDNGSGISKDKQKSLFKRFYEGDYRKFNTIGTGIGLSLVKDLVELHGGSIEVESEEGRGTEFIVTLPVDRSYFKEEQIDEEAVLPVQKTVTYLEEENAENVVAEKPKAHTILVVEDNEELLQLMVRLLKREYNVHTAENGQEAVTVLDNEDIDLIVSDVMMPVMDGIEFCRYVKNKLELSHIPVILLTAKNKEEDRAEAYEVGADAFISKPFNLAVLHARIRNLLKYKERKAHDFKNQLVFEIKELDYTSIDEDFMQRAIDCVNRHLEDSDFDQPQFVEEMGTSKSTLYKKLKSLTGLNTSAFIRNIRLKAACRIMEEKGSSVRVSDLAYAVGFNDPKYFSSCFKKEFGMLPTEYQERFIQS